MPEESLGKDVHATGCDGLRLPDHRVRDKVPRLTGGV